MPSIVQYLPRDDPREGSKCGYCHQNSSFSDGMWAYELRAEDYQSLIDRGWRRCGQYCYKPQMKKTCCKQYTIRCDALAFKPSKSQKKVMKRLNRFLLNGRQEGETEETRTVEGDSAADMSMRNKANLGLEMIPTQLKDSLSSSSQPKKLKSVQMEESTDTMPDKPSQTVDGCEKRSTGISVNDRSSTKKKFLRKQRWAEKQKAKGLGDCAEPPKTKKDVEKTLEEWLTFPDDGKHKLEVRMVRTSPYSKEARLSEVESHKVYTAYQMKVHNDKLDKCDKTTWKRFLISSPILPDSDNQLGSFHQQYWLDNRLMCVAVLDVLPDCVSSVYFYYDPAFSFLSLGTLSALMEIKLVRSLSQTIPTLTHYYMGYYIHTCPKMVYKAKLPGSSLLCPETYTWQPIEKCSPMLDESPYSRLNPDSRIGDEDKGRLSDVNILYKACKLTFDEYQSLKRLTEPEVEDIGEYCDLVGCHLASSLLLLQRDE